MLLSMVIARFSKSVYRVSESIDGAFKLKFAQQTYQSVLHLTAYIIHLTSYI